MSSIRIEDQSPAFTANPGNLTSRVGSQVGEKLTKMELLSKVDDFESSIDNNFQQNIGFHRNSQLFEPASAALEQYNTK